LRGFVHFIGEWLMVAPKDPERSARKIQLAARELLRPEFWKAPGIFLAGSAAFALAYTQTPLYGPNQDQYFLHGLARAGYGFLSRDWLAGTTDPTPLFSLLVEITWRLTHWAPAFYLIYALLLGVYYFSAIDIGAAAFSIRPSSAARWSFAFGALFLHSALFRAGLARALSPWGGSFFEDGLAEQRILGAVLQPSVFGVLLVVSVRFFIKKRPYAAVLFAVLAAAFHPTYLLCAAILTAAYVTAILLQDRDPKRAALAAGLALLCALPVAAYVYSVFAPSDPGSSAETYRILVHERLPHHALIRWWWTAGSTAKVVLIALGLAVVRKTRLFPVLLIPALLGAGLTLVQLATGGDALALLFPWRISSLLVPLSSLSILAAAVDFASRRRLWERLRTPAVRAAALLGMILLASAGIAKFVLDLTEKESRHEQGLFTYISVHHQPEQTYLIPPKMEEFRLRTGSPAYIDLKSIPYRDLDVLEWYRRLQLINRLYLEFDCSVADGLRAQGAVTHVVLPVDDFPQGCPGWVEIYRDDWYGLYAFP
jgi:hypothetical protein